MVKKARTNRELTAAALFRLGGAERAIDLEELAMQVAQLAPGRFRWKRYPEQINLEAVYLAAKSLLRAKPPLVTGGKRDGWMLTRAGIAWCIGGLGEHAVQSSPGEGAIDPVLLLRQTEAFHKFQRDEDLSIHDVRRFLRVDEYSSRRRRKERVQAIHNAIGDDAELLRLVDHLRAHYPEEWS